MYLKNIKGEEINTKEKAIVALIHTANFEQIPITHIWCFEEQCNAFNIDKNGFYKQKLCKQCEDNGIEIYHYKDNEYEYRYEWKHC